MEGIQSLEDQLFSLAKQGLPFSQVSVHYRREIVSIVQLNARQLSKARIDVSRYRDVDEDTPSAFHLRCELVRLKQVFSSACRNDNRVNCGRQLVTVLKAEAGLQPPPVRQVVLQKPADTGQAPVNQDDWAAARFAEQVLDQKPGHLAGTNDQDRSIFQRFQPPSEE